MREPLAVIVHRVVRLSTFPALGVFALACDDARLPHEPLPPAQVLISGQTVPTRQQLAALAGVTRYWADGYVWSSNALRVGTYPASGETHFNVASGRGGSPITITKVSGTIGQYTVEFPGLSAWLGAKSTVHVTSETASGYGIPDDVYCKPVTAYLVTDKIDVRCFRVSTGAASDGAFRVLTTRNYLDLAFAHAHLPASTNYVPEAKGSWNPAGASKVIRHAAGRYEVVFSGLGLQLPAGVSGHFQVNGVGTGNRHCKVENWNVATDVSVWVRCFTPAGQLVDSKFVVLFVTPAEHLAYTIGDQPSTAMYSPLPTFSSNPAGGAITIARQAVGKYRITWTGVDPEIYGGGNYQVTGWGSDNSICKLNSDGSLLDYADLLCFGPSGVLTDAKYVVLMGS